MYTTKLTSANGYNVNNMIFSKPETGTIPGSVPKISFKRIRIGTKNDDGTTGDLIIETPKDLFSFGLQENREMGSGNINGYVLPLCLWNKNGCTDEEKNFTNVFEEIVNHCKTHLLDNKDKIERYDLDMSDLKNFNPLYWKKDKGKIVEGKGPVLYLKTLMSKKNERISTIFINEQTNEEMDPFDVLHKYCFVKGAIKVESIFIGNKISLQIKLYEVLVRPIDMEKKSLLTTNVIRKVDANIFDVMNEYEPVSEQVIQPPQPSIASGSLNGSSDEEEETDDEEENEQPSVIQKEETVKPKPAARKPAATKKK